MRSLPSPLISTVRLSRRTTCGPPRCVSLLANATPLSTPNVLSTGPRQSGPTRTFELGRPSRFSTTALEASNVGDSTTAPSKTTFEDLGLHPPIVASLGAAFPHVEHPTDVQTQFIPAILDGKDVFLRDSTGSGKSFGLVLALLNKPRIVTKHGDFRTRHITSLVLVPHKDLAYQYLYWIKKMVRSSVDGSEEPPISAIAQVLARDNDMHLHAGLDLLKQSIGSGTPPHILIATPQALLDIHNADDFFLSDHLSSSTLSVVCVDEADYLIETLPRKDPSRSFKKGIEREMKRLARHPGPTKELLNIIYKSRREWSAREDSADLLPPPSPQLLLSSATLRTHLRNYVYEESGWLDRTKVVKIYGGAKKEASDHLQPGLLLHSVILVSAGRARNVEGALESPPISDLGAEPTEVSTEIEPPRGFDTEAVQRFAQTPSPFNPCIFEAIATAFALDVPSTALLVLPASAPLSRAVWELRELGINAWNLDLNEKLGSSPDNPTLLVSTSATIRGVDLPRLSHVFVHGLPDVKKRVHGRSVDAYVHIAGRAGRFGRGGKVITFVEETEESEEGDKMVRILETINVRPVKFGVFD